MERFLKKRLGEGTVGKGSKLVRMNSERHRSDVEQLIE